MVRSLFLPDYAEGGHDKVYKFIPKNEIWIEIKLSKRERKFIILHELHERYLMAHGEIYSKAHRSATIIEDYARHHPKELENDIQIELFKNNEL